jgi:hypothetical protein
MPHPRAPARQRSPFAAGAGLGLIGISLLGWFTGMRGVMHALLVTFGAHAPVPFAVVLGLVSLFAAAGLSGALLADTRASGASLERAARGSWLARAFYAQLGRQQRSPWVWGAGSGVALGLVGIWLVLAALVIPLEMSSLDLLLFSKLRIDTAQPGGTPPASADGALHPSAWQTPPESGDMAVIDAFGRAIQLEPGAASGYRLRSLGLDGRASGDDLCVNGPAPLATLADPLAFLEQRRGGQVSWVGQVTAIGAARCAERH